MSRCMKGRLAIVSLATSLVLGACGDGQEETATPQLAVFAPVTFASTDGVQLSGSLFGQGRQGIILAHMFPADQESWLEFAGELAGLGYLALPFDFHGYGDSEGDQEFDRIDRDVEGALDFLEQRGVEDVFLIGASMGGPASLKVASRRSVSGVVSVLLLAGLAETSAQTLVLPGTGHGTDMLDGTIRQSVRDVIMDFPEED